MDDGHGQRLSAIRMDWGSAGAAAICRGADYAVIADILSFTTTLSVAIDGGADVFPYRWRDSSAAEFAARHDAVLARGRSEATRSGGGISLSPASVRAAAGLTRLVLPSPNGSALASQLSDGGAAVVGACFRNRTAVAQWLARPDEHQHPPVIAVIAAGEKWADGSLRPAAEDLWGAGAVICALTALGRTGLSPEARTAAAAFAAVQPHLEAELLNCSSGRELADLGFSQDVAIAAELDVSTAVPVLADGRFTGARRR